MIRPYRLPPSLWLWLPVRDVAAAGNPSVPWTPHTFRKTVATLISERVDAETASQQLGHSSPAITREFCIAKPAIAADVAHVLDELAAVDPEASSNTW